MWIKREAIHVWGQRIYGKSLYLPFNLAVKLKLFLKKVLKIKGVNILIS